jgi:hypothetical protein
MAMQRRIMYSFVLFSFQAISFGTRALVRLCGEEVDNFMSLTLTIVSSATTPCPLEPRLSQIGRTGFPVGIFIGVTTVYFSFLRSQ